LPAGWGTYNNAEPGGDPAGWWRSDCVDLSAGSARVFSKWDSAKGRWATGALSYWDTSKPLQENTGIEFDVKVYKDTPGYLLTMLLWPYSNVWPSDGEIDFCEQITYYMNQQFNSVYHYGTTHQQTSVGTNTDLTVRTKVGVLWTPGKLEFTVNGVVKNSISGSFVKNVPMRPTFQMQANATATWGGVTYPGANAATKGAELFGVRAFKKA